MIKKLAQCVGAFKKDAILSPVLVALEVVMEVIIPLLMALMIDRGITGGSMRAVVLTGVALVVSALLSLLFGALAGKYAARASTGFAANLRKTLFYRVQDFSFANIDHFSTSGLVTRLTTDVTNVQNAFQMIIRVAVRSPLMLVSSLVMAFGINSRLALIYLAVIPVLAGGLAFIMTHAYPIFTRVFKLYDKLNNVVQENLRGIRVVKSYVREDYEVEKFEQVSGEVYDDFVLAEKLVALNSPLMQFCMYGCILLLSWFGASFIASGAMTTGQLTSLFTYTTQILMALMMLSMVLLMVIMARASAQRITAVLDERSDIVDGAQRITDIPDGSVRFEAVDFSYRGDAQRLCLQGIHLDIRAGETVGIIGGTGSGKSSLVQLIPRLYDATGGSVLVGGIDVRDYDLESLRDAVAMVLQKNVLFSGTIRDNLRWGKRDATDAEIEHACKLAQADAFIRAFPAGYDTMIEQGGTNVSGGQRQRLCIARALLKQPKILILDDSTSAVDTRTDAALRQAFREEIPDTTKIIIAQRIASVQDADQIIVMDDGRITAVGDHEKLMRDSDIYREVYQSQQKGSDSHDAA